MSQMQSSFDPRSRFVILWTLAEMWFPMLVVLATPWLAAGGNHMALTALSILSAPISALCQMPLLRAHVPQTWRWPVAGLGAAILYQLLFTIVVGSVMGSLLPRAGGGLSAWLPYFLFSGALAGIAHGLPQAIIVGRWGLGGGGWFLVVLGASLIASAIGGVIWVMTGAGTGSAEALPFWTPAIGAAARQVAFGAITGVYLWQRLQQRAR